VFVLVRVTANDPLVRVSPVRITRTRTRTSDWCQCERRLTLWCDRRKQQPHDDRCYSW